MFNKKRSSRRQLRVPICFNDEWVMEVRNKLMLIHVLGLEVGSMRRIQGIGYDVLEFFGVETTFDIFHNIIFIPYFQDGVLVFTGYGVLIKFCGLWELVAALNGPLVQLEALIKPTTSASGSKPSGNTKNNRITRPPRSNQKNKVEDHPRKVKSSLNKMNYVTEPISNALVKHSVRNAKFESILAKKSVCGRTRNSKALRDEYLTSYGSCPPLVDIFKRSSDFYWPSLSEFNTACYTQTVWIRIRYNNRLHMKANALKTDKNRFIVLSVFGSLCYPTMTVKTVGVKLICIRPILVLWLVLRANKRSFLESMTGKKPETYWKPFMLTLMIWTAMAFK
ncbi:hypothetical protein Tco_0793149 [Tanacetum coccineum]